jgi:hypothetical protein
MLSLKYLRLPPTDGDRVGLLTKRSKPLVLVPKLGVYTNNGLLLICEKSNPISRKMKSRQQIAHNYQGYSHNITWPDSFWYHLNYCWWVMFWLMDECLLSCFTSGYFDWQWRTSLFVDFLTEDLWNSPNTTGWSIYKAWPDSLNAFICGGSLCGEEVLLLARSFTQKKPVFLINNTTEMHTSQ